MVKFFIICLLYLPATYYVQTSQVLSILIAISTMSLGQSFSQPSALQTQSFSPTTLLPLHASQPFPSQGRTSSSSLPSKHTGDGRGNFCLLVRHFPAWVNRDEKESLLRHFGAKDVVVMGNKGRMVTRALLIVMTTHICRVIFLFPEKLCICNLFKCRRRKMGEFILRVYVKKWYRVS